MGELTNTDDGDWELDVEFTPDFLNDGPQILMEDEVAMALLRQMYPLLEREKKDKRKNRGHEITLPDREGVSGDGNKSGIPRNFGTAAGDEWGSNAPVPPEVKRAQAKYKGNFDKEEMYALAGVKILAESEDAKVVRDDKKFYYVDVPGHGEVKVKKGNLLGIGEKGVPADVVMKALKAAGKARSTKRKEKSKDNLKQAKKAWHSKKPKSRSLQPKMESLGKDIKAVVKNPAVSGNITVYPDGSGAPAALKYKGITIAFDFLGKVKANRLGKIEKSEGRKARLIAMKVLTAAYQELLKKHTDEDWLSKNAEMYQ